MRSPADTAELLKWLLPARSLLLLLFEPLADKEVPNPCCALERRLSEEEADDPETLSLKGDDDRCD
jgi:hypothetical protein